MYLSAYDTYVSSVAIKAAKRKLLFLSLRSHVQGRLVEKLGPRKQNGRQNELGRQPLTRTSSRVRLVPFQTSESMMPKKDKGLKS